MRWGVTKLQVADLAGAQPKKSLSAIEQPSTSADSSIIEDTRVHDSLVNNANILETKEAEKEIDAEAEPSLEEGSSSDSAKSSNVQCSNIVTSDTVASANSNSVASITRLQFGYLYIDESGQLSEPDLVIAVSVLLSGNSRIDSSRILLAGDPLQLGPIVHSQVATDFGLGEYK
ncbi:hypothetical protein J6590_084014 [Homalodisca vitripennis]|nr:hypothetical protein J6590_084014 [Homalodisca vitripennis]